MTRSREESFKESARKRLRYRTDGGSAMSEQRKPFWVKCSACGHVWAAAYLPMVAEQFAKAAKACCPNCAHGPKGIFIAKQDNGVLNEPLAPHQTGAPT